jgi:hypothetical protein
VRSSKVFADAVKELGFNNWQGNGEAFGEGVEYRVQGVSVGSSPGGYLINWLSYGRVFPSFLKSITEGDEFL